MNGAVAFCTCSDRACPHHPSNHDKGCTPCIGNNLRRGEIPTCFFVSAFGDVNGVRDWSRESFVRMMLEKATPLTGKKPFDNGTGFGYK